LLIDEDIIATDTFSRDCFFIFLIPSKRYFIALEDIKLTLHRILHRLNEEIYEYGNVTGMRDRVEFYSGCNFLFSDPLISIQRLIYEARKELLLNSKVQDFMFSFINNISHEFKTPLTCIKGYVETLLEGAMSDKDTCQRFLDIISFETDRLVKLTSDLLDLSTIKSSFLEMNRQLLDMGSLICRAMTYIKPYADKKDIKINYDRAHFNSLLLVDGDRITQVIINLLENAIKYSSEGSSVDIVVKKQGEYMRVEITDEGDGIPVSCIPKIFEMFTRVDDDRSLKKGGRGLGLAIAKNIIELHRGIINAKSETGKGSTFYFLLKEFNSNAEDRI
ncbi:MAG TPA: ATP-binding protein, partial [Candidatus Eremiobacteraeota bacterium]|nr:ATP-binding protein [Candidatus Eremiobacteraeota bacterium]